MFGYVPMDDTLTDYYRGAGGTSRPPRHAQMTPTPRAPAKTSSLRVKVTKILCAVTLPTVVLQVYFLSISAPFTTEKSPRADEHDARPHIDISELLPFNHLPLALVQTYVEGRYDNMSMEDLPKPVTFEEYIDSVLQQYNETLKTSHKTGVTYMWEIPSGHNRGTLIKNQVANSAQNEIIETDSDIKGNETLNVKNPRDPIVQSEEAKTLHDMHESPHIGTGTVTEDHRDYCPLEYNITTCSFAFIGDASIKASITDPMKILMARDMVKRGMILINGRVVHEWSTRDFNLFFVRVNEQCQVVEKLRIKSEIRKTRDLYSSEVVRYMKQIPEKTLLVGIAYGTADLVFRSAISHTEYRDFVVSLRQKDSHPSRMKRDARVMSFVIFKGFAGLSRKLVTNGNDYMFTTDQFSFGHPFPKVIGNQTRLGVIDNHRDVAATSGGQWTPTQCRPRSRIAIIVPFRNREKHLTVFLDNIITFLKKQNIAFRIFVVEQTGPELFNRASLMNVGYLEANEGNFDCYVFHDVDQIPEDLANWYHCSPAPRHLMASRSYTGYTLKYPMYFGGAISLTPDLIEEMNGFPNRMFGWGGEDDDMFGRLDYLNHTLQRLPIEIGRYTSLHHQKVEHNNPHIRVKNGTVLRREAPLYMSSDGLSAMNSTTDIFREDKELYTHILVRLSGPTTVAEVEAKRKREETRKSSTSGHFLYQPIKSQIMILICLVFLIS